jgi:hypothetical protein
MKRMPLLGLLIVTFFSFRCVAGIDENSGAPNQESGFVIYKDQDFYSNELANAVHFIGFIDRRAVDGTRHGHISFALGNRQMVDVPSSCILGTFLNSEIEPANLNNSEELEMYKATRTRVVEVGAINSRVNSLLLPVVHEIDENIRQYEIGNRRINGQWITPAMAQSQRVSDDKASIRKDSAWIQEWMQSCFDMSTCKELRGEIEWLKKREYVDLESRGYLAETVNDLNKRLDSIQATIQAKEGAIISSKTNGPTNTNLDSKQPFTVTSKPLPTPSPIQ